MKKHKALIVLLFLLISAFVFSLFKNISFPLLWNDEAETAVFAERILKYGYPKVHDGKNTLYLLELPRDAGLNHKIDAYVGSGWGQYYFCVIGNLLAKNTSGIYVKTALLRMPFAFIGLLGLIVIALSVSHFINKNLTHKLLFLIFFVFFELFSVSLILHLREVRYYSILIFLSACIFYSYFNYRIARNASFISYSALIILLLILIFNTFSPAFFIFFITIGIYELYLFAKKRDAKEFLVNLLPLFITLIPMSFLLTFFKTFIISREAAKIFTIDYFPRLLNSLYFFQKYEFLSLLLFVKIILISLWFYLRRLKALEINLASKDRILISNFLSVFFITYLLIINRMPTGYIFERYYLVLQPILVIIILLDAFSIFELINFISSRSIKSFIKASVFSLMIIVFMVNVSNKIDYVKNHFFELFHQYKGPLDYVIPYIQAKYPNTKNLVIATNYEEPSYMYYLDSKITFGCMGKDFNRDLAIEPDIIIFRKRFAYTNKIFMEMLNNNRYKKISFPVFDYPVNNDPELNFPDYPNLYKTKMCNEAYQCLDIYVR